MKREKIMCEKEGGVEGLRIKGGVKENTEKREEEKRKRREEREKGRKGGEQGGRRREKPRILTTVTYSIDKQVIDTNAENEGSADIFVQKGPLSSSVITCI